MNKKAQLRLDKFLGGLLIFAGIFLVSLLMIQDMNVNYDKNISTDKFNSTYNILEDTYNITVGESNDVIGARIEGGEETSDSMLRGAFKAIRGVRNTFVLFGEIINVLALEIGIPSFLVTLGIGVLLIGIVWSIIFLIMRFQPR